MNLFCHEFTNISDAIYFISQNYINLCCEKFALSFLLAMTYLVYYHKNF